MTQPSPRIVSLTWGRLETADGHIYSDARLYPGGGSHWDWALSGNRAHPGVRVADVQELLDYGAQVVVVSLGYYKRLPVSRKALELLEEAGLPYHLEATLEAMALYNRLAETEAVGGLFHTAC